MLATVRNPKMWKTLTGRRIFVFSRKLHSLKTIEIPNLYLDEMIWRNLDKWSNKTATVCAETNRSYTYQELYNKSNSIASFLHKFGMVKDDTVAIMLPNIPEYPIVFLGAVQAGVQVTPLNPSFTPGEISKQLLQTNSKLVFCTNEKYTTVLKTLQSAKLYVPIVTINTQNGISPPNESINFDDISQTSPSNFQRVIQRDVNDTVVIPFSSGTGGHPKGVELTHRSLVSNLHQMCVHEYDTLPSKADGPEQDVMPFILPMYHCYGMTMIMLQGLLRGCKLVTVPKLTSTMLVNVLDNFHTTALFIVPPIVLMLLSNSHIKRTHFMNIKTIMCAGASLGKWQLRALREKVGMHVNIIQAYGMTEASPLTHIQTMRIKAGVKPGGVGLLIPSTEAKIILPESGKEVDSNEIGEIVLRGPQIMKGYYKNEKANQEVFMSGGWLKTGDLGYYDDDGHFFITGRRKELIKVKGYQVAPAELEELILGHPDVDDVAVVGVPHDTLGEAPKAFVVRKHGSNVTPRLIEDYVKENVVKYKQLSGGVSFIDSIPKNGTGKILRNQLKELL
ncbi:4-coumarate--CoA ligase 1-like isoform X2 [Photinus pyralis]|uniref:4-coumarate--CoA ligase 1-like isoform X2 n=1 Tax=Photinus pyralis TaxID=7054 RepID=UPI00126778B3|nr:4-coumarate--CoA ligase 1-like isoform X2 [Photinus pyralis]